MDCREAAEGHSVKSEGGWGPLTRDQEEAGEASGNSSCVSRRSETQVCSAPCGGFQGHRRRLPALFSAVFLVGSPAALRAANRVCRPEAPRSLPASASPVASCCVYLLAPSTRMSRLLTELLLLLQG